MKEFNIFLVNHNLSKNTIESYLYTINNFFSIFSEISKSNLLEYKDFLINKYKPKTVNLRIQALNKYLEFISRNDLHLSTIKFQQATFLENVISNSDYEFLKNQLKQDNNLKWYFIVRFLGATGARVSELVQFKIEHINVGHIDIYSKGGKIRRIYIPKNLLTETRNWIKTFKHLSGYLFINSRGNPISTRGIAHQLRDLAIKYNMNVNVVHPHSFRHLFAKNFLDRYNDLALLSDLLGHESIETTRIYLRRTSTEQKIIVDKYVTW